MKKVLIILFYCFSICSCSENEREQIEKDNKKERLVSVEYHILPQSISFMPIGSGDIFQFCAPNHSIEYKGLLKYSKYVEYDQRGFNCNVEKKQLCTYFYKKDYSEMSIKRFKSLLKNLKEIKSNQYIPYSRAVICTSTNLGRNDTVFINEDKTIVYHGLLFELSDSFLSEILSIAPLEIQENWKYELGSISDLRLDQIKPR